MCIRDRGAGARPGELLYSNPVKRRADVAAAHTQGVRLFVVDSIDETAKVADAAPGASVLARLSTTGVGSDWSLSGKFGCSTVRRPVWPGGSTIGVVPTRPRRSGTG